MPNLFSLIGDAWNFSRKQSVLRDVLIWLMILPNIINSLALSAMPSVSGRKDALLLLVLLSGIMAIFLLWGSICVYLVARRTTKTSAGRTRSSFAPLRKEAATLIVPVLLTGILRMCIGILWSLLFIIPGIVYTIRRSFAEVVIVTEGLQYRAALQRSADVVRGHTVAVFGYFLGLGILLFLPPQILSILGRMAGHLEGWMGLLVFDLAYAAANAVATMLYILCIVQLFGALQKLPRTR